MFGEFRAVVGQDKLCGERKDFEAEFKEFRGGERGVGFRAPGKAESGIDVFERNDIPAIAVQMLLDGVESHQMPWIESFEILGLSNLFLSFQGLYFAEMRYFLRKHAESSQVFDNSSDSGDFRTFKTTSLAEFCEFRVKLVFSEIGMRETQALNFRDNILRPDASSSLLGSAGFIIQRFQLSAGLFPDRFPVVESPPLCRKSV